jgi:ornithine carbamoyltransferase
MEVAAAHGGSVTVMHDPRSAVDTGGRAPKAEDDLRGVHALPAGARGIEATAEVVDGPASIIWQPVANRLPTQ